jgi:hypothetical protein
LTRFIRCTSVTLLVFLLANCGSGGPSTPTGPTQSTPPTPTRIVNVSGNLAFGDVSIGSSREMTMTISNSGNATLTVTSLSVSGGLVSQTSATWTNGTIAAGSSQVITIRFTPTASGAFSGTVLVNGDQTAGTNSIPISATATFSFSGTWLGNYVVERCDGTGSLQDVLCSTARGSFPVGTSLPIRIALTQNGNSVVGTVSFGTVTGPVSGSVSAGGVLTLQGTATSGTLSIQITSWSTSIQGNSMSGNVTYNASLSTLPGVAVVVSRLSGVTRQ